MNNRTLNIYFGEYPFDSYFIYEINQFDVYSLFDIMIRYHQLELCAIDPDRSLNTVNSLQTVLSWLTHFFYDFYLIFLA